MIPTFETGRLPKGIHHASWAEFAERFGTNARRRRLLDGLHVALMHLLQAGCRTAYVAGSFVTNKALPGDVDVAWSAEGVDPMALHPAFLDPRAGRDVTKALFGAEFFPAEAVESDSELTFVEFFQIAKDGQAVGIVALDLTVWETDDDS